MAYIVSSLLKKESTQRVLSKRIFQQFFDINGRGQLYTTSKYSYFASQSNGRFGLLIAINLQVFQKF